ncbi:hypothetical protein D5018_00270 [Parashewanella curva]|uniref:GH18 domain-containing protein n=1 Tax=Parashewanella curva TaxID=2338552 RepID=A0A3L8Q363_9GAMM|nr:hypothetical protein [Parashewanella curva]RLV61589.1 hypothetical protein D5018_00270 [Parashewanella curva]
MMKKRTLTMTFLSLPFLTNVCFAGSAIYAGGSIYKNPETSINELKNSGFDTIIVWTIHVHANGDLNFNEEFPLIEGGKYVGDNDYPNFRKEIASLKTGKTKVQRIEFGLSGAGSETYSNIKALFKCDKTSACDIKNNILYKNFKILKETFPDVDGLNNDDEDEFDMDSSVIFHNMLSDIGFKTTISPYGDEDFWKGFIAKVNAHKSNALDYIYLQGYSLGEYNSPCDWNLGLPVSFGFATSKSGPNDVYAVLSQWKQKCPKITQGGFMFQYDDIKNNGDAEFYAQSINDALKVKTPDSKSQCE